MQHDGRDTPFFRARRPICGARSLLEVVHSLAPGGRLYILLSSDSDLDLLSGLIARARFRARAVAERSILIESLIIYQLQAY